MFRHLQFILFSFIFTILYSSCSFQPNELKIAEELLETAPDSALHILQNLSPTKYKSDKNRALYGLLMVKALDMKMLPLKPDSLLEFSIAYYQNYPDDDRLATCYLYEGRTHKYGFQYEKAVNCYLKALDELKNSKNDALFGRIHLDLGEIYNIQRDYSLARQKFNMAYTYLRKCKLQSLSFYSILYVGRTYHEAKEYKKAEIHYRKINPLAKDSLQKGSLYQEMGMNFFDSKQYDSALIYYRKIINYPNISNNRALRYYLLSNLYLNLKQVDSAFYYATESFKYNPDIRTQRECYRILTNSEFLRGNMTEMSMYMNKYVAIGDSLRKIDAQTKGSYIETMHTTEKEAAKNKNLVVYLSLLVLLILISAFFLYRFLSTRSKKEKTLMHESHTEEKAIIRKDVVIKYGEVLLQKIEKLKAEQTNELKKANYTEKVVLTRKIYNKLLHLNNTDLFFKEMDSVLNNLATKLKTRYPSLTTKEISWCCLSLLDVPTADIYVLLEYTVDGLKTMRKRLAQKTGLSGVAELKDFLEKLIAE